MSKSFRPFCLAKLIRPFTNDDEPLTVFWLQASLIRLGSNLSQQKYPIGILSSNAKVGLSKNIVLLADRRSQFQSSIVLAAAQFV